MRFTFEPEVRDFTTSVDALLTKSDTPGVIRSWSDGDAAPGLELYERLAETGVNALLLPESLGGMDATAVELVAVLEVLGRHAVPGPVVETVAVAPRLLGGHRDAAGVAESLASGAPATVAAPPVSPFAADPRVARFAWVAADDAVFDATDHDGDDSGVGGSGGGDGARPRTGASSTVDRARTVHEPGRGEKVADACSVDVLNHGALGTAAQLLGLASAMLDMSVDYAKQRSQFGRPIGEFQALKHKMSEVAIAVEMARPLLWAGALAIRDNPATDADGRIEPGAGHRAARDVSAARVACGDAAALAAEHALQIHGGIGYTLEHDLGLWLTKSRALHSAWGTADFHRGRVLAALESKAGRP